MEQIGKKWARLLVYLGGKLSIYPLSSSPPLSLPLPPSPQSSQAPSCAGWAGLVGPMLGSVSQMLPWGKQQHLSPAQPWLSLSDKSLGGSCQRCPACHLSPLPPTQYPQPSPYTHIYTHTHTSPYLHLSAFILTVWQKQVVHSLFALWPSMLSSSVGTFMQGASRVVASSKYQWRTPCTRFF